MIEANEKGKCVGCINNQPSHLIDWHGMPCPADYCGCKGAWGDVPDAWLPVKNTDDDQQEAS